MSESVPSLLKTLTHSLEKVDVEDEARKSGFRRRAPRKLPPWQFLQAVCLSALEGKPSLRATAMIVPTLGAPTVSRQGLGDRMGAASAAFVQGVTCALLALKTGLLRLAEARAFRAFAHVLIQDSTVLPLHEALARDYPGSANQRRKTRAAAKVQALYNLLTGTFCQFSLSSFRRNDQAASPDILAVAQRGDLVLRDLGFFVLQTFAQMNERGIYFLSRLRQGVSISQLDGRPFALLRHLRRVGSFDGDVLLGEKDRVRVRLVALPIPPARAEERRRKLPQNRDKRCRVTPEQLALCGWILMITNVPLAIWDAATVCEVHGARWRIEILFKVWKSHLRMEDLPAASKGYVDTVLWARLLVATLFCEFFSDLESGRSPHDGRRFSLLKTAHFFAFCLRYAWINLRTLDDAGLEDLLLRFCCYDTRHDRRNFPQFMDALT